MSGKNVQVVKDFKAPVAPGLHFRLLCLTGPDKGLAYFLKSSRVVMGRGDQADIQVQDTKASREHAELVQVKNFYVVSDLGSQNGLMVNDLKVSQHRLKDGDRIVIGQTVYKYTKIKIKDPDEETDDEELDTEDWTEEEEVKPKSKKGFLMLVGLIAVVALFLMGGDPEKKPQTTKNNGNDKDLKDISNTFAMVSRKQVENDKELRLKLAAIIHRGLREYREGNFFRAIAEFNMALVLSPKHGRASFYLNKAKQALDDAIEKTFLKARQEEDALKLQAAAVQYCGILRLLGGYEKDERYMAAKNNLEKIEKRLGLDKGEINCL